MNTDEKNLLKFSIAKRTALVAAIVAVLISVLMLANFIQIKTIEPLTSPALQQLMLKLQENPNDVVLKEQIRSLDLLARKAYFTNLWQVKTGSFILFVSVIVLLISLKILYSTRQSLPDFNEKPADSLGEKILARKSILITGLSIFAITFVLGLFSQSEIASQDYGQKKGKNVSFKDLQKQWPSFRGAWSQGIYYGKNIPESWNVETGENIKWKVELELPGFNSPLIWDEQLFISGADKETQQICCFSTKNGERLWSIALDDIPGTPAKKPRVTEDTGYAASTMTTDGSNVYVIFATGDLACVDFNGNLVWGKNIGVPDNHYGHSSSLLIHNNILLVQFDHNEGNFLFGYNTQSGAEIYRTERDQDISWASPTLVEYNNQVQLLLNANPHVIGYDPLNGQELWRVECMSGEVAPSPAYYDGYVYVVNEYAMLAAVDLNDPTKTVWTFMDDLSEVSSPVAANGFVVVPTSYGSVSMLDAKTGETYWMHDFPEGFYSSPIVVGENIYLTDMEGTTFIFKLSKEFTEIAHMDLGEDFFTVPAFMDGRIYFRGSEHLICVGN